MSEFHLSRFKIKKFRQEVEPQEVLLDSLSQKKEKELGISEKKVETPLSRKILRGVLFISFAVIFILFAKTFQLQILEGEKYSLLAQKQQVRINYLRPERGVIYDRNLKQLVFNKPSFDLMLDIRDLPRQKEERQKIVTEVSKILEIDHRELKNKIANTKFAEVLVLENIPHQILIPLEAKISEFPGFWIEKNTVREYPEGFNAAHLLGYTSKISAQELSNLEGYAAADYIGKTGLEKYYEEILRGKAGIIKIEKDAFGNTLSKNKVSDSQNGKSLVLWLDFSLQKKIREALLKTLNRTGAEGAAAVALDPKTGGVLALVSLPSFDNNLFSQGISQSQLEKIQNDDRRPLFNRAISGWGYPTGSTIKPLVGAAALEEGIISPEESINCQGVITVKNPYYPEIEPEFYEYHDWMVHGLTDIRKAIAESCNIFFYTLGGGNKDRNFEGLGASKIIHWLKQFGWGEKTGIDLPSEGEGILSKIDENWTLGKTYHLSIGQGPFSITPLQVAAAFSAIANGGKLLKPQIVQGSIQIIRQDFVSPENLQVVIEGMRQAVSGYHSPHASAVLLNSLPVKAAAKTGTAEASKEGHYHNWLVVFAPFDDPQIVLTIVVESVRDIQAAALPAAKEILQWYFTP